MPITHKFVSNLPNRNTAGKVQPSDWNDSHNLSSFFEWGVGLSGVMDGINATFILPSLPINGKILLVRNGIVLTISDDYSISGATVTFRTSPDTRPQTGDSLSAYYFK